MQENEKQSTLEPFCQGVNELLVTGEKLVTSLGGNPDLLPGWKALKARFSSFQMRGVNPVLIATLYGPSGAGKSTLFKLLTGVDVPAGGAVRPCSMACAAAVPESLDDPQKLAVLFPGYVAEKLVSQMQIRQTDGPDQLLFATYAEKKKQAIQLVLVDVPDFNTVEKTNWDKAEKMLERAEVVIFMVYDNAYSDDKVIQELARCCKKSASMAYMLTMTNAEAAKQIWADLLQKVSGKFAVFQEQRADGKTLHQFLSETPVYFSPRSEQPSLENVYPLNESTPPLQSLLQGFDAEKIIISGLREPALQTVVSCMSFIEKEELGLVGMRDRDRAMRADLLEHAKAVAFHEFPAGRLVQIVLEEARRRRPWYLRVITSGFEIPGVVFKKGQKLIDWLRGKNDDGPNLVNRNDLERKRLHEATEHMGNQWRGNYPDLSGTDGVLSSANCENARNAFTKVNIPEAGLDWETEVRKDLAKWAEENKWKCAMLATVPELAMTGGIALLMVDLCTTGGRFSALLTNLGIAGTVGGVGAAVGVGIKFLEDYHLNTVAENAQNKWKTQRTQELLIHMDKNWAAVLLQGWRLKLKTLIDAPIPKFKQICMRVQKLLHEGKVS
ncbi:MAG: ATP-binding cassette domain-containing protein [Planctomycetota bacterium]|nr:ATP-binding cassette domain-containing protein [Planctomycetota bacterium]